MSPPDDTPSSSVTLLNGVTMTFWVPKNSDSKWYVFLNIPEFDGNQPRINEKKPPVRLNYMTSGISKVFWSTDILGDFQATSRRSSEKSVA